MKELAEKKGGNLYSLLLLVLLGLMGCGTNESLSDRPNILWISHEDLSPIYGCYGDTYARTPYIDSLFSVCLIS